MGSSEECFEPRGAYVNSHDQPATLEDPTLIESKLENSCGADCCQQTSLAMFSHISNVEVRKYGTASLSFLRMQMLRSDSTIQKHYGAEIEEVNVIERPPRLKW